MVWPPKYPVSPEDLTEWVTRSVSALDMPADLAEQPGLETVQARNLAMFLEANTVAAESFKDLLAAQLKANPPAMDPQSALTAFAALGEEAARLHGDACELVRANITAAFQDLSDDASKD